MTSVTRRALRGSRRPAFGFDLDGVLMVNPFDTCVVPRLERLLAKAPPLSGMDEIAASKSVRQAIGRTWRRRMATGDLAAAYDWDAIYREVAIEFAVQLTREDEIEVARWVRDCCDEGGHVLALPGAAELLSTLSAAGARLVVISNGFAPYQEPVLAALGLLDFFDDVVTPDRAGHAKPDRRIFEAAGELDAFVGDTLTHDVLGARKAGIAAIWMHAPLPPELLRLTPSERASSAGIVHLVRASLAASPHTAFHPEADIDSCRPDAVVASLAEVGEVLLTA